MIEKIKAFFGNKSVRMVCIAVFCVSCTGLIVGGLSTEAINGIVVAITAVLSAVSALIAYISKILS